jgi:hypothetical protein
MKAAAVARQRVIFIVFLVLARYSEYLVLVLERINEKEDQDVDINLYCFILAFLLLCCGRMRTCEEDSEVKGRFRRETRFFCLLFPA